MMRFKIRQTIHEHTGWHFLFHDVTETSLEGIKVHATQKRNQIENRY